MKRFIGDVKDLNGVAAIAVAVNAYRFGTMERETLYADEKGILTKVNPIYSNAVGEFTFYAQDEVDIAVDASHTVTYDVYDCTPGEARIPIKITALDRTLVARECFGSIIFVSAAKIITLPPVFVGASVIVYGTGANAVTIDPDAADRIVLAGVALIDGRAIVCTGVAGSYIHLIGDSGAGWTTMEGNGTWAGV